MLLCSFAPSLLCFFVALHSCSNGSKAKEKQSKAKKERSKERAKGRKKQQRIASGLGKN
jgi:hypothetical protein